MKVSRLVSPRLGSAVSRVPASAVLIAASLVVPACGSRKTDDAPAVKEAAVAKPAVVDEAHPEPASAKPAAPADEPSNDTSADVVSGQVSSAGRIVVTGFDKPESVVHDPEQDVYFLTSFAGNPADRDDNGFISKIAPDGEVLAREFITGASEDVTLHAPKGIALVGDAIAVTDLDMVRFFDRKTGAPREQVLVEAAGFLNDIVADGETAVFVTDSGLKAGETPDKMVPSGTDAVFHVTRDGKSDTLLADPELGTPNGIELLEGGAVRVLTMGSGTIFDLKDGEKTELQASGAGPGTLDGIVMVDADTYWISSWERKQVLARTGDAWTVLVDEVENAADIGIDRKRNRVLVPRLLAGDLWIQPLPQEG